MRSWRTLWYATSILAQQVLGDEGVWHDAPWVRRYDCGEQQRRPSSEPIPFWIDSFRGELNTQGDSTELNLGILTFYNLSLITKEEIDVASFKNSLEFQLLGHPIGQLQQFRSTCPLPVTDTLTPLNGSLACAFHLTYTFDGTYHLRMLTSTFVFKRTDGAELDCGITKIIPDFGKTISATLIFVPLSLFALVTLSSLQKHQSELGFQPTYENDAISAGERILWASILDITKYLRHLQFIFISASMTLDYPGFFVPIVSKLAWTSLLYWTGPISHGYSHKGIDGGMYTSNFSYGAESMTQALGYPNMLNTLANSWINLGILMAIIFFLSSSLFLHASRSTRGASLPSSTIMKKAAGTTVGLSLCFFSVPLLSYMAYDLFLVGYLPNYRIGLAVLILLILIWANYFATHLIDEQLRYKPTSACDDPEQQDSPAQHFDKAWKLIHRHLPQLLPLIQAIGIGGLQEFPIAQLSLVAVAEVALLLFHLEFNGNMRSYTSANTFCSSIRLLTIVLSVTFIPSITETTKQWIAYVILCLHGLLVLPYFFIRSCWQLCQAMQKSNDDSSVNTLNEDSERSLSTPALSMDDIPPCSPRNPSQYRMGLNDEPFWQYHKQDPSSFYRKPRLRTATPLHHAPPQNSISDSQLALVPSTSVNESEFDLNTALAQVPPKIGVDYSFREADLFYGVTAGETSLGTMPIPGASSTAEEGQPSDSGFLDKWKHRLSAGLKRHKPKEQEKGFHVVRPPRNVS